MIICLIYIKPFTMLKRPGRTFPGSSAKKKRKTIDINTKLKIIKQHEEGEAVQRIANSMGWAYSPVSTA